MTLLLVPGAGNAFNHGQNTYELLQHENTENSQVRMQQMPVNTELALGSNLAILPVLVISPEHEGKRPLHHINCIERGMGCKVLFALCALMRFVFHIYFITMGFAPG